MTGILLRTLIIFLTSNVSLVWVFCHFLSEFRVLPPGIFLDCKIYFQPLKCLLDFPDFFGSQIDAYSDILLYSYVLLPNRAREGRNRAFNTVRDVSWARDILIRKNQKVKGQNEKLLSVYIIRFSQQISATTIESK